MSKYEAYEFNGKIYKRYFSLKGSKNKYFTINGKQYLHRDIYEYHNGKIPKGYHIHHKDGNPLNNSLDNLECLLPRDHCKSHSILAKIDPTKNIYESRQKWHKSLEGAIHHKEIWKNRKKIEVNCHKCNDKILKYKCGIGKYICKKCKSNNTVERQKKNHIPKIKKEYIPKIKKEYIPKIRTEIHSNCEVCKVPIIQKTKCLKRFCSKACKAKERRISGIDNIVRKCLICDNEFTINRYCKTQTCSGSCRGKYITLQMRSGG